MRGGWRPSAALDGRCEQVSVRLARVARRPARPRRRAAPATNLRPRAALTGAMAMPAAMDRAPDPAASRETTLVDLRGSARAAPQPSILEDATGRRRLRVRRLGRAVSVVFALWLIALLFGGLGVIPIGSVPLGGVVAPPARPPLLGRTAVPLERGGAGPTRPPTALPGGPTRAAAAVRPTRPGDVGVERRQRSAASHRPRPSGDRTGVPSASAPASAPATVLAPDGAPPGVGQGSATAGTGSKAPSGSPARGGTTGRPAAPGRSTSPPGHTVSSAQTTMQPPTTTTPGAPGSAPGHAGTAPGDSHRPPKP